jgi:predicted secreted protein
MERQPPVAQGSTEPAAAATEEVAAAEAQEEAPAEAGLVDIASILGAQPLRWSGRACKC